MAWNNEEFIALAQKLDNDPVYQSFINSNLPNTGDSLDDICAQGLANYLANSDALMAALRS